MMNVCPVGCLSLSLSFLDLPASLERHKRRNQVARQAGSQLVTHFARIQSRRVSQVATVHLSPPPPPPALDFPLGQSTQPTPVA